MTRILHYVQQIVLQLSPITETWLAEWFINNYIHRCVHLCPDNVLCTDLQDTVSGIIRARFTNSLTSTFAYFLTAQHLIFSRVSADSLTVRLYLWWITELTKIDRDLSVYFTAVAFLHVAHKTARMSLEDRLLDVLDTACLQPNDLRRCRYARHSSVLSLSQAAKLMEVATINSRSTIQLIEIELSKAYLYRALRCKDSDSDPIYCLANVYLAVLYYRTLQNNTRRR